MIPQAAPACCGRLRHAAGGSMIPRSAPAFRGRLRHSAGGSSVPRAAPTLRGRFHGSGSSSFATRSLVVDCSPLGEETCRSYTQEQSVLLLMDLATILVTRVTELLSSHQDITFPDLLTLLPVVKLTCDWMTCHPHLWYPAPCSRDPLLG